MSDPVPLRSPLHAAHLELGARMVPFAGWEMPVQYEGIIPEHTAVREGVGVFDISHMGQVFVRGEEAAGWLNSMLTNDIAALGVGEGQYTLMLNPRGGVIDDLIAYRSEEDEFFLVINAAKIPEDLAWLQENLGPEIELEDLSDSSAGLAIQGPGSTALFEKVFAGSGLTLPPRNGICESGDLVICRTGYTGEEGFEFFCPDGEGADWLKKVIAGGATACGLGARDTLRLEMCYPLNGSDLSPDITPLQAGLGFFVKLEKGCDFMGRDALLAQKADGLPSRLCAIQASGKMPPMRAHYAVFQDGEQIAELTSGAPSPSLGHGIGMAYLPAGSTKPGTALEIDVRGRRFPAEVVKKPFLKKPKKA